MIHDIGTGYAHAMSNINQRMVVKQQEGQEKIRNSGECSGQPVYIIGGLK
jgi:hypothetical protein